MSASVIAKNLTVKQLKSVLNKQPAAQKVVEDNKTTVTEFFLSDIRSAGSKHLAYTLKLSELEAATAHLEIEHGNNRATKPVLSKRLKESLEEKGFTSWLQQCDDINVLRIFADNLEIIYNKSTTAKELVSSITKELELIGLQIVFGNLSVDLLRDLAVHLKRNNADIATSKTVLVNAITLNAPIPEPQKRPVKRVVKGTKRPIEKCTTYQQIFQHYNVDDIVEWCREQGVKTSGNKKELIERVLAFLSGDKENTMSNSSSPKPARKATTKKTETKKTTKKAAPKKAVVPKKVVEEEEVDEEEEQVEEEEEVDAEEASAEEEEASAEEEEEASAEEEEEASAEEEEKDQEADEDENQEGDDNEEEPEEMDIDAERALRTIEQSESEISLAESEEESIEGLNLCITGTLSKPRDFYEKAIKKAGGILNAKLTKKVKYLIIPLNADPNSAKFAGAVKGGVEIRTEDFLQKLLKM